MFVVLEFDDDGKLHEIHGPGSLEQAVAFLDKLVFAHCGAHLDEQERQDFLNGLSDEVDSDDGWSWEIKGLRGCFE